jgi:hypothetical protein
MPAQHDYMIKLPMMGIIDIALEKPANFVASACSDKRSTIPIFSNLTRQ